ncbi:hypothetical protein ADK55_20385 [Streptomyces sp. WM4235]|nr:hypothetical protein ADK55_20385 [Streptomyces sp. WM4235]
MSAAPISADSSGSRMLSRVRTSSSVRSAAIASRTTRRNSGSPERQLTRLTPRSAGVGTTGRRKMALPAASGAVISCCMVARAEGRKAETRTRCEINSGTRSTTVFSVSPPML